MLDQSTAKGRIMAAAMALAAERPWQDVLLKDIAGAAGMDLVTLRREFPSKSAILSAFIRATDDAVLSRVPTFTAGESARDRLFDVIMTRFDVLQPYKPALQSIAASRPFDMELGRRVMASQAWMLHAAGIGTEGILGASRVTGLASVYAGAMDTWLADNDAGHARTMAALDRRLRRGEQSMRALADVMAGADQLASQVMRVLGCRAPAAKNKPEPDTATPASPSL